MIARNRRIIGGGLRYSCMERMMLKLSMTCGPYDRARALIEKRVQPAGIDLDITVNRKSPGRSTMGPNGHFDAAEFYTGQYIADLPRKAMGYTAIPIFVKRAFRHSSAYINNKAGIRRPSDLNGKRVGVQHWFTSAGVWARGVLEDEWGLDVRSITWVSQGEEGGFEGWTPPNWLKLEFAPAGQKLPDLLNAGQIQGLFATTVCAPGIYPNVDYLFPDFGQVERDYFKRTNFFPIMHTLLIRTELLEREPWVAMSLFDAWMASKQACYDELKWERTHKTSLWYRALREEEMAVAGDDFYRWGFKNGRAEIAKWIDYAVRYGIIPRRFEPEELFHPSTLDT
jgi:4,5-dihydroxyphthalate decarboxylase